MPARSALWLGRIMVLVGWGQWWEDQKNGKPTTLATGAEIRYTENQADGVKKIVPVSAVQ